MTVGATEGEFVYEQVEMFEFTDESNIKEDGGVNNP